MFLIFFSQNIGNKLCFRFIVVVTHDCNLLFDCFSLPSSSVSSRLHLRLTACISLLLPILFTLLLSYARTCFAKTETSSHRVFLKNCTRDRIVTVGFKLSHSPSDLHNTSLVSKTNKQNLPKVSFQLISPHIHSLQDRLFSLDEQLYVLKKQIL